MQMIDLETGKIDLDQLTGIFRVIPQEFDFIDENDIVRWYSNNNDRIFGREISSLNQHVLDVHPKHSANRIKKLLADMHSGNKTKVEMVIPAKGKQIQICFYAVYDHEGKYRGCIEVTQDVSHLVKQSRLGNLWKLITKR